MTERPLTPKEQAFIDAYLGVSAGNGTDACRRAGYKGSAKILGTQAVRLMAKPMIQQAIAARRAETQQAAIMTATEMAVRLSGIAMGVITERRVIGGKNDFVEVDLPPQCSTQIEAMKTLAKVRGYEAPTKTEHSGSVAMQLTLTAEQDAALEQWLAVRDDPRVQEALRERGL